MKKNNPHTPIMLREALGTEPKVFARYGMFCFLLSLILSRLGFKGGNMNGMVILENGG